MNTHELALELVQRGHVVSVLAGLSYRDMFGLGCAASALLSGQRTFFDDDLGYPVGRSRKPWLATEDVALRPDVVVVQHGEMPQIAAAFRRRGVPAVAYLHGLNFEGWALDGRPLPADALPFAGVLANSEFTAQRFRALYAITPTVLPPIFRKERYRVETCGKNVTFINPVAMKGVQRALDIAELCPDIPFSFVRAWPLPARQAFRLNARLGRLPNVVLRDRTSDMRDVYRDARIVLVPSQCDETWGRVASEAHLSGIPVVATNRGGLPEAVGPGGILIAPDAPVDAWVAAIRRLWTDAELYQQISAAALDYARRPLLDTEAQLDAMIAALQQWSAPTPGWTAHHRPRPDTRGHRTAEPPTPALTSKPPC
ncbi:MAG: glycosyltransferase family 4 protein [Bacteroidales bacterium]|nr:glycosyltransferase family 4 protein [Bacteroidales bacterium]